MAIEIRKTTETGVPIEKVWRKVSDLENEHKPWPMLSGIKILGKTDTTLEREVKVRRGPMGEAKSVQTLVIDPGQRTTTLTMTKGPMLGMRTISLNRTEGGRTRIDVYWKFEMKGVPSFALGFVKDSIADATVKAMAQIVDEEGAAP